MSTLIDYNWPGNIRELENMIHRALILADNSIDQEHFPQLVNSSQKAQESTLEKGDFKSLSEMEREYIERVLEANQHNKTKAAEILGITRKTLANKLKR